MRTGPVDQKVGGARSGCQELVVQADGGVGAVDVDELDVVHRAVVPAAGGTGSGADGPADRRADQRGPDQERPRQRRLAPGERVEGARGPTTGLLRRGADQVTRPVGEIAAAATGRTGGVPDTVACGA